jgi:hypothetical protein
MPSLILIYHEAYRSPSFLTLGLSTDSRSYTLRIMNTQQQNRPLRTPFPALVRSHAQILAESIHIILQIIYTPKAQALFVDKFTKLQTFHLSSTLSLSPIFCSYNSTRTTRRSGESQAFSQDRLATDPSHSLCPSKFDLSILYRSIDLLTTIFLISSNCLIFFF